MLNELHQLAKALKTRGLLSSSTHQNIGKVGKSPCLLIKIDQNKKPAEIVFLSINETGNLWRHSKGNHNSFPAIRLKVPFLLTEESEKFHLKLKESTPNTFNKLELCDKINLLKTLDFNRINYENNFFILNEWSKNELSIINKYNIENLDSLKDLIKRLPSSKEDSDLFIKNFIEFINSKIKIINSSDEIDLLKDLLVGEYDIKNKKYESYCMTYLDIADIENHSCSVRSSETKTALIKCFNLDKKSEQSANTSESKKCALSGEEKKSNVNKYPQPKLPILGLTYFYSKNEKIPCLDRYGMIASDAFPASESAVSSISDALEFLTAPEREKKTWKKTLSSNKKKTCKKTLRSNEDKHNLLLAYLEEDPDNDALLADILDDPSDAEKTENAFSSLCEQVLGSIKNISFKNPNSKINLIILETHDPGRKQIVYFNSFSVQRFCENLKDWEEGSENFPPICFTIIEKGEEKRRYCYPLCVSPQQICRLLKNNYKRATQDTSSKNAKIDVITQDASAITTSEIYDLYMPQKKENDTFLINSVIQKTLLKSKFLFQASGPYKETINNLNESKDLKMFISLISILLWKLNIKKENYMTNTAFNIGQLLQLTDLLHREYCVQVRNGGDNNKSLPGQLIGNELLPIATENPNEGLNRLRERMRVYISWAKSYNGEKSNFVKWILKRSGEVCAKISEKEIPKSFDCAEQAQVFLGYLAAIPSEKRQVANESNNINESSENE